jgi:hypothetical protein
MTSPLSYLAAREAVSDLRRTGAQARLAHRVVPHRGRVDRLWRVTVELRLRAHRQTPPTAPAHLAVLVDSRTRPE